MQKLDPHTRGDTWYGWEITINQLDDEGVSTPADLTGASVLIQFRKAQKKGPIGLEITEADCTIESNTLIVNQRDPEDFDLAVADWVYDIQITWASGAVDTITSGILPVVQDISV